MLRARGIAVNWDAIGAIGEIIGAVGVLMTLFYLAVQIKKSSEDTRNSTIFSIMSMQAENRRAAMSSDVSSLVTRSEAGEKLSGQEERKLMYYEQASLQDIEAAYIQYLAGTLPEEVMDAVRGRLTAIVLQGGGWSERWERYKPYFTKSFVAYVDEIYRAAA